MTQPSPLTASALQDAFTAFNQLSAQLAGSYHALEHRVVVLNDELAKTHDARLHELTEKERLAQRLSTLLQVLPGGVVVLNGGGCIQEHNNVAKELLGEPLTGELWLDVIKRAFAPRHDDGHDVSLVDGRRVNIATCPMLNEPGQILLLTEVTQIRVLQEQLGQQQRLVAMGEMAAALAHQIRTPLASALLYTAHLKRPDLAGEDRERFSEKVRSRLAHLERIVNDMLLYARSGNPGIEEPFNTQELLQDLEHIIDAQVLQSKTHFQWRDETQHTTLLGNRQMLVSALANLAVNAMQAMQQGGCLQVIARCAEHQQIEIRVMDNGPGISAANLEHIFDPFYTTRADGTGLGLAVVRAITHAHQGEIKVESRLQQGTTFILRMPLLQAQITTDNNTTDFNSMLKLSRVG
jgi:two-component system sensor histidine kinase FlrB